jgi:hypothetical protein
MDVLASTALVLGLLSLFTWLLGPYGIGLALAGIIVALLGWHAQPGGAARLGCALSYASLLAALFVTLVLMRYHLPPFAPPGP